MLAMFVHHFVAGISVQVQAVRGLLDGFQVTQRVRVHSERDAQDLALDIRATSKQLLVDTNGQRRIIVEDRKTRLQGFE